MNNQSIARKGFDYISLPDKTTRAVLKQEAMAIKAAVKRTHDNIIEIGTRLQHAKEVAGHGKFLNWIDAEFSMSERYAQKFMQAAEVFLNTNYSSDLNLSQTAIFALTAPSVDEETRGVIIEEVQAGNVKTAADVKEWIDAGKPVSAPAPAVSSTNEPDDFDDEDPFADEDVDAGEPNFSQPPAAPNAEESEPSFVDENLNPSNSTGLESEPTVNEEPKVELSLEEQVDALPLIQALSLYGHNGHICRQDALFVLQEKEWISKTTRRFQGNLRHKKGGRIEAWRNAIAGNDPTLWEGCASCKGSLRVGERMDPCARCNGMGYTTRKNEGVSADVVRSHAESLR